MMTKTQVSKRKRTHAQRKRKKRADSTPAPLTIMSDGTMWLQPRTRSGKPLLPVSRYTKW